MHLLKSRNDLGTLLKPGAIGAEIGVWRGYFSVEMLKWPLAKLYLVDAWKSQESYSDPLSDTNHEANLRETQHNIRGHIAGGRVEIVRGMSLDVAKNNREIPPLDIAFIDADHSRDAALADLKAWSLRMKRGGLLCGHDYVDPEKNESAKRWGFGVIAAVEEFCRTSDWRLTHLTDEEFASFVLQRR